MNTTENLDLLRKSFRFSLDVIDFHDKLVEQHKGPIAERVLKSTLSGICSLQKALESEFHGEVKAHLNQAIIHLKNVIYWMEQCDKSGYLFKKKVLSDARSIYKYCVETAA